jgi:hypothetical protein
MCALIKLLLLLYDSVKNWDSQRYFIEDRKMVLFYYSPCSKPRQNTSCSLIFNTITSPDNSHSIINSPQRTTHFRQYITVITAQTTPSPLLLLFTPGYSKFSFPRSSVLPAGCYLSPWLSAYFSTYGHQRPLFHCKPVIIKDDIHVPLSFQLNTKPSTVFFSSIKFLSYLVFFCLIM